MPEIKPGDHVQWGKTRYYVQHVGCGVYQSLHNRSLCRHYPHGLAVLELVQRRGQWLLRYQTSQCIPADKVTIVETIDGREVNA